MTTDGDLLYVNIFQLDMDGKIKSIYPHIKSQSASDNRFEVDAEWHKVPRYVFKMTEPLGAKSWIAIATKEPLDLRPLLEISEDNTTRSKSYENRIIDVFTSNRFRSRSPSSLNDTLKRLIGHSLIGKKRAEATKEPSNPSDELLGQCLK